MTKEEKAREIIRQGGRCDHIYCETGNSNECPAWDACRKTNGTNEPHPDKIAACEKHLGIVGADSVITLTSAIASLERSCASAPESCRAEIREIIEEVVYLRNRISQGGEK